MMRATWQRWIVSSVMGVGFLLCAAGSLEAHWLSKVLKEAAEAGKDAAGTASRVGIGALDDATSILRRLPKLPGGRVPLAAHANPEGHWKFTNSEGLVFTAATPEEMGRVAKALVPDVADGTPLSLYLSEETVFLRPKLLDDLPVGTHLNMVFGNRTFELVRKSAAASHAGLYAKVRPNVLVRLGEQADFKEAIWQLGRALPRGDVRVLSLKPGGPVGFSRAAKMDPARQVPMADEIDPASLASSLSDIRGQTALVTGRIEGELLYVQPAIGGEQAISLSAIRQAAAAADVNLIVLRSAKPLQPGTQNWLWQTVEVDGLGHALKKPTFGDFLYALARGRDRLVVSVNPKGSGRVLVEAVPDISGQDLVDGVSTWLGDTVSEATGHIVTEDVEAFMTSQARQKELDDRILPGIPSDYQFYYIGALVMGVIGLSVARSWWQAIWPSEDRSEYGASFGYLAARAVRWLVFVLVFLPLVGPIALLAALALQVFNVVMVPVRLVGRLIGYRSA